ncbi:MAG TPA: hypothetical protein VKC54_02630 [Patescibacteria group bacterium]|nr:hypothetical protein [Patescibacteria group bacterium]
MKLSGPVDLIKRSIAIFFKKENLTYFLKVYLVLVPFSIFFFFEDKYMASNPNLTLPYSMQFLNNYGWFIGVGFIFGLLYLIISFWVTVAGITAVIAVVGGKVLSVKETFAFAWKKLWKFSLLTFLFGLMVAVGGILLIIPGIYLFITYYFSKFILVEEDTGVSVSLGKSRNLVKGKFWKVFGRIIVFGLFSGLITFVVSALPYGLGSSLVALIGALFIIPSYLLYRELSV